MRLLDVLRVARNRQHVEPGRGALLRDAVLDAYAVLRFPGPVGRLHRSAGPGDGHADVAVGQVADELRGTEVGDVRAQLRQVLLGSAVVFRLVAVGRQAEIVQHLGDHLGGRVEEGHAALLQLRQVLRLEHQVPGVQRRIVAEHRADLVEVVGDAVGAPHVGHHVAVAGVLAGEHLEQGRVEVLPVRQLALVQRLEHLGLQVVRQEAVAGHHQVVAGMPGQQLGLEHLVAVVDVVLRRDAGLRLEVLQGVRGDVVEPVVDPYFRRGLDQPGGNGQREAGQQLASRLHASLLSGPRLRSPAAR
ncbi:hypothetical protein PAERUG_P45_London_17_VIM_2_12_12_02975 [Pseudomonas aeruginosa]|nr:hypothetical protein PAERUG_P45_London_17_VIM_2_12_12_02975 [Pseudomonas aeruginosa]